MTMRKRGAAQYAKLEMRRRHTLIGFMMEHKGDADGMICGTSGNYIAIGPILLGCATPAYILTSSATVWRIVNMTALCVVNATAQQQRTCASSVLFFFLRFRAGAGRALRAVVHAMPLKVVANELANDL